METIDSLTVFRAKDYNVTVVFYWAPFIVESNSDDAVVNRITDRIVRAASINKHDRHWRGSYILVFNTYLWWMTGQKLKILRGSFKDDMKNITLMEMEDAYRMALRRMVKWVKKNMNSHNINVFFTTMSPSHERPGCTGICIEHLQCASSVLETAFKAMPLEDDIFSANHGVGLIVQELGVALNQILHTPDSCEPVGCQLSPNNYTILPQTEMQSCMATNLSTYTIKDATNSCLEVVQPPPLAISAKEEFTSMVVQDSVLNAEYPNDEGPHNFACGTFAMYSLICRHSKVGTIPNQQIEDMELSTYNLKIPNRNLKQAEKLKATFETFPLDFKLYVQPIYEPILTRLANQDQDQVHAWQIRTKTRKSIVMLTVVGRLQHCREEEEGLK